MDTRPDSKRISNILDYLYKHHSLNANKVAEYIGVSGGYLTKAKNFHLKNHHKELLEINGKGKNYPKLRLKLEEAFNLSYDEEKEEYTEVQNITPDIMVKKALETYHLLYYRIESNTIQQGLVYLNEDNSVSMNVYGLGTPEETSKWEGKIFNANNNTYITISRKDHDHPSQCQFILYTGLRRKGISIMTGVYSSVTQNGEPCCGKALFIKSKNNGIFLEEFPWEAQSYLLGKQIVSENKVPLNFDALSVNRNILPYCGNYSVFYPSKHGKEIGKGVLTIEKDQTINFSTARSEVYQGQVTRLDTFSDVLEMELQEVNSNKKKTGMGVHIMVRAHRSSPHSTCHSGMLLARDGNSNPETFPILLVGGQLPNNLDLEKLIQEYFSHFHGRIAVYNYYEMKKIIDKCSK